uniref:Uncharacterized protein n=1 Tax=Desulfovibrio sp. U5L TaxID=596152 RepID=I2PXN9_9BACT
MPLVKKIIVATALALLTVLGLSLSSRPQAGPAATGPAPLAAPARADLAEAVFAMVLENARTAGMTLPEPPSLCQACVAAHLGLPGESVRERCGKACGLR